jgi:hypothetical protein
VFPLQLPATQVGLVPHVDAALRAWLAGAVAHSKRGVRDGQPLAQSTGPLSPMGAGGDSGTGRWATGLGCPSATPEPMSPARLIHAVSWLASRSTAFAPSHKSLNFGGGYLWLRQFTGRMRSALGPDEDRTKPNTAHAHTSTVSLILIGQAAVLLPPYLSIRRGTSTVGA